MVLGNGFANKLTLRPSPPFFATRSQNLDFLSYLRYPKSLNNRPVACNFFVVVRNFGSQHEKIAQIKFVVVQVMWMECIF